MYHFYIYNIFQGIWKELKKTKAMVSNLIRLEKTQSEMLRKLLNESNNKNNQSVLAFKQNEDGTFMQIPYDPSMTSDQKK